MVNPANNYQTFGNNPMEVVLKDIEERLLSDTKIQKERKKEKVRLAASVALSIGIIASGGTSALLTSQLIRCGVGKLISGQAEIMLIDKIAFVVGGLAAGYFCHRKVMHYPMSANEIRDRLREDSAYQKLKFSENFDRETVEALQEVAQVCPITMAFPRFPVRDVRRRRNGELINQVYEWAALSFILTQQPAGQRSCSAVNYATFSDFEFCEDLCREIHQILYARNVIDSEDPLDSLRNELQDLGDLSLQEMM